MSSPHTDSPYLLDTHIWFWYLTGSERLPVGLRTAIGSASGELWISPISFWELGVLEQRGLHRLLRRGADVVARADEGVHGQQP